AITGNPASKAGYDKMGAIGEGLYNLVSDSVDTYAYIATGDAKYKAGFDANAARGDAIVAAGEGWVNRFKAADTYEKTAMVTEDVENVLFAIVGTKGLGSTKLAGEATALSEVGGASRLSKLADAEVLLSSNELAGVEKASADLLKAVGERRVISY